MSSWSSPSIALAVHRRFGECALQAVVVGLEDADDAPHLVVVGPIARLAEADVAEYFLDLAIGEGVADRELLAERLGAVAGAGERARPAEQRVRALPPAVVPVIVGRHVA